MKKGGSVLLVTITLIFVAFTAGLMLGRYNRNDSVSIEILSSSTAAPAQPAYSAQAPASSGKLNINTASLQDLQTLPGIGATLAQRIVDYRTVHGDFASLSDLANVEGIGTIKLLRIMEMITVED